MHPYIINEVRTSFWAVDLGNQFLGHQGLPVYACWSFTFGVLSRTMSVLKRVNNMDDLEARITRDSQ
jgi:hypothetical protein